MVRSNPDRNVGFLSDERRMNVAITRAKTFVAVVCDSATVSSNPFLGNIVKYITAHGQTFHAKMYVLDPDFKFSMGAFAGSQKKEGKKGVKKEKKKKKEKKTTKSEIKEIPLRDQDPIKREERVHEEDKEKTKLMEQVMKSIDEFLANPEQLVLELPENLNSYDRLQVHNYVEKRKDLEHESAGDGEHRRLVLRKNAPKEKPKEATPEMELDITKLLNPDQAKKIQLAEEERKKKEIRSMQKKRAKERKAKLAKMQGKDKKGSGEDDAEVEAMLSAMIKDNKLCSFEDEKGNRCPHTTEVFARLCQYCTKQYCLDHIGQTIHRCARTNVQPQYATKADPAALKSALNAKLNELKALRVQKPKKK